MLATLVRDNRHIALALWLITVVPALGALAMHHYTPRHWLHWADAVFFAATGTALAIAWLGERTKRSAR